MDEDSGAFDSGAELRREIRDAIAGSSHMEFVKIGMTQGELTVTVDIYTDDNGTRRHLERSLYEVHTEPTFHPEDAEPLPGDTHLHWTYLGAVEGSPDATGAAEDQPNE